MNNIQMAKARENSTSPAKDRATLESDRRASLLTEDVVLPAAVLVESKLRNNVSWMQRYAQKLGVGLAPHGKTTMTPALFHQQIEAGAWGITLATAEQVAIAYQCGIRRIMMANQLVGKSNMDLVSQVIADPDAEFYCLIDSLENLSQLQSYFDNSGQQLNLLIEIRAPEGRCGCNNIAEARALALAILDSKNCCLAGIEFYEGALHNQQEVDEFLAVVAAIFDDLYKAPLFYADRIIFSGAGSVWYDRVAQFFAQHCLQDVTYLLRPGCYLIHDKGIYEQAQRELLKRDSVARNMPERLQSSLEVWAYVLSTPLNSERAIVGLGKRDVAFDAGLPIPVKWHRPGWKSPKHLTQTTSLKIMDQHLQLATSSDESLQPGDLIGFATSHPCLTFDKWKKVYLVDDAMNVQQVLKTCFRIEDCTGYV